MDKPSEEIQQLLKRVVEHYDMEDRSIRERQIRLWKKLKYYWDGFQRVWWNEVAHDWRTYDTIQDAETNDAAYYDKQINIFRAFLESIIAALSVSVPSVVCFPDDAENPLDLSTARAGNKIGDLIYKHNDAFLLWLHALYIFCTEGLIFAYNYTKEDESYGTYTKPEYKDEEIEQEIKICPICHEQMADEVLSNREADEYDPGDDDVEVKDILNTDGAICPHCLEAVDPEIQKTKVIVTRLVGITTHPKSRQRIEVHGGLFCKIALYAQKQCDTPYLIYAYETDNSYVLERWPELREKYSNAEKLTSATGTMSDGYEKWARLSTQYRGQYPTNTTTVRNCWLRPCAFNVLPKKEAAQLTEKYPDGCRVVLVNDIFCEAENECLDDHWTLSHNPLSDYLHHDPLGNLLVSVQDITNDMVSLVLQTIEHGIPQTFADPETLDFNKYAQMESTPGAIYAAKPKAGRALGESFYEVKTAQLSGEVLPFSQKMQEAGQLVSGALPSLFGGVAPGQGKTAAQYSMSRAQALQRLNTTYKILQEWWKGIFGKVIPAYIKDVAEDERIVERADKNNYVNVVIRKAELMGKIGSVELDVSDQLPLTWQQKKDVVMQLMNMNNPEIMNALIHPENIEILQEVIGLEDFAIPGEDDRQKQYEEIEQLLASQPLDQMTPSVGIDPMLDNNAIHAELCKRYLISERGRLAKIENPAGYQNILLHMQQHVKVQQAMSAMAAPQSQEPINPNQNDTQPKGEKGQNGGNAIEPKQPSVH